MLRPAILNLVLQLSNRAERWKGGRAEKAEEVAFARASAVGEALIL